MTKISITGHRKLLDESEVRSEIALKLKNYKETYKDLQAVSALAEGADTIFVEEAIKLGIPVSFVLPFSLEEYRKDFSAKGLEVLQIIIENNGNKYEVETTGKISNVRDRNKAYLAVGKKLVNTTDILMAVWDGQSAQGEGGTDDIVNYAIKQGKIINIIKAHRLDMEQKSIFYDVFQKYDNAAVRQKGKLYNFWTQGIILGWLAVFTFAISVSFYHYLGHHLKGLILPILEALFVFLSFIFIGIFARRTKRRFLLNRHYAEYLRIHILMTNCGFVIEHRHKDHHDYPMPKDIKDLESEYVPEQTIVQDIDICKTRLKGFIEDQNRYNSVMEFGRHEKTEGKLKSNQKLIRWLFAFMVAAKLVFELMEYKACHFIEEHAYLLSISKFFIIVIPPTYAAMDSEGLIYLSDLGRNIEISEVLNKKYNDLQNRIVSCQNIKALKVLAKELYDIFWHEQNDWLTRFHNKEIEPRV